MKKTEILFESTVLRKMTFKSQMKFGKWADSTVGQLIGYNQTPYLRWVYYNASNIDFMSDVLDAIHISEEYRIPKPGKNPELANTVYAINAQKAPGGLIAIIKKNSAKTRRKVKDRLAVMNGNYTKNALRNMNQGKF